MLATRLFDYINIQFDEGQLGRFAGGKQDNEWYYYSTHEVIVLSRQLASGLISQGVSAGDKIGIVVSKNRPEWVIADLAIQYIGAVSVPMYPTISPREYAYIIKEAEVKICFADAGEIYQKLIDTQQEADVLKQIISFDKTEGQIYWKDIMDDNNLIEVQHRSESVVSEDLVTIIYTSGTTGNPKGVMLTHANIISEVESCTELIPINRGERVLSFLPLCHIFERAVLYVYTKVGMEIHFTGTDNLGGETGDLIQVQPSFFTTVPRLLEKVYEKIYNKGQALKGIKKFLFFWALRLCDDFEYGKQYSGIEKYKRLVADKLIFSKWRAALGGHVRAIAVGAAACPSKIARVFSASGVYIMEGYGLTETSPVLTMNHYYDGSSKIGTVGVPLGICDIIIDASEGTYSAGEGEILAAGPNVMSGYYKQPEQTSSAFKNINGIQYFRTGDIGTFIDGPNDRKYLKITDRKKELIKTSGGKYVAPAPIEASLKENFLIEQVMIVGEQQKFVSALIVPAHEALVTWCQLHNIKSTLWEDIISDKQVIAKFQAIIDEVNPHFSHIEQIKKFALLDSTWDISKTDGTESELTPTLKLKRRVITKKYDAVIQQLYRG